MKNSTEDQLKLDFENGLEASQRDQLRESGRSLVLVHSKACDGDASVDVTTRDKILGNVLSYARSLKW